MYIARQCLIAAWLVFALSACAPDSGAPPPRSKADLFNESCGACHGEAGKGPSLAELRALPEDELRAGIRNHPTAGQIAERLSADRIDRLIEYLGE